MGGLEEAWQVSLVHVHTHALTHARTHARTPVDRLTIRQILTVVFQLIQCS